ncbi:MULTISPECIES: type II toxin-antitoxin system HicA family toxin [unclassified Adlercreutzia]|uniref:type II toxin-antitoxin system HicA family toxin n=1 Tax=unclassified Adlercreutzia TaxID=2636013 RepID=UPI00351B92F6
MVKRRDLVRELIEAGFVSRGGKSHEVFAKPGFRTVVPRHRELKETTAREIRKQSGLE